MSAEGYVTAPQAGGHACHMVQDARRWALSLSEVMVGIHCSDVCPSKGQEVLTVIPLLELTWKAKTKQINKQTKNRASSTGNMLSVGIHATCAYRCAPRAHLDTCIYMHTDIMSCYTLHTYTHLLWPWVSVSLVRVQFPAPVI